MLATHLFLDILRPPRPLLRIETWCCSTWGHQTVHVAAIEDSAYHDTIQRESHPRDGGLCMKSPLAIQRLQDEILAPPERPSERAKHGVALSPVAKK